MMMTDIRQLLIDLRQRGVHLSLEGGSLRSRSTPGAITADIAAQIRTEKLRIIDYLRENGSGGATAEQPLVPVPRDGPLPLSSAQRGVWFIDQLAGSTEYILTCAPILLREAIDRGALQQSLDAIVERHESLRTVLVQTDGEPGQRVMPPATVVITDHDLTGVAEADQLADVYRIDAEQARMPFDLQRDPMLRVALLKLSTRKWVLLVAIHHVAADGWSIGVLQKEFSQLYGAARQGRVASLPPLPVQYADYAAWQHARMQQPAVRARLDHWRRRLQGVAPVHSIPLDRPRLQGRSAGDAGLLVQPLDSVLAERLRARGRTLDATLFMVLHAALSVVFARWADNEDVLVGIPVSGRSQQALAPLIGFFANTLALRVEVGAQLDLDGLIRHVRERCLEAYDHQDVPFDRIVEALRPERNIGYNAVVQLMFSLLQVDDSMLSSAMNIELLPGRQSRVMFDLDVMAVEEAQGLTLRWTYDRRLFNEGSIQAMMDAMALVLQQLADPERAALRVADLDLLGEAGASRLRAWNQTARPYPRDTCLHTLIEAQAARTPERIALKCAGRALSYVELNGKANALAHDLISAGVRPGDVVPVVMRPGLEVPLAFLAVMKAGAAFAPLDAGWPAQRLERALAHLGSAPVLVASNDPATPHARRVCIEELGYRDNPGLDLPAQTPIYAIHTSGSTGTPKAALNMHRGIVNRLAFMNRYFGINGNEVVLQTTDHCFDSSIWQFFWPLVNGGTCVLPGYGEGFDLPLIADLLCSQKVTLTDFSPALLSVFLEHIQGTGARYPDLRALIVGGEEMTPSLAARCGQMLPAVKLHNFYGPSEASIGAICHALGDTVEGVVPIGRPIDNVVVALVDDALRPVPIGCPGEILLGGDCVGIGYLGDAEASAAGFIAPELPMYGSSRFYRTGDMARYRSDGQLEFLGRRDSQVKIRGFRVDLGEVRIALEAQGGVMHAHVRVDGTEAGRRLLAWVVLDREGNAAAENSLKGIREGLRHSLPGYMQPASVLVVPALPMTAGGKIDSRALPLHAEGPRHDDRTMPTTAEELALAAIWAALFGASGDDPISADDDFFERGGHSLLATQLVARVRTALQVELPLQVLFANPRLCDLAQWCAAQRHGGAGNGSPIQSAARAGKVEYS